MYHIKNSFFHILDFIRNNFPFGSMERKARMETSPLGPAALYRGERFCFLFLLILALGEISADEAAAPRDDFDDLIAMVDENPEISNMIASSISATTRQASKNDIINLLDQLGVLALLIENLFLRTNNLNSRSLLDYPEFIPWRHDKDKRAIYVDLFYNQMSRANFTKQSSNICSYLAVTSPSLIQKIEAIIENVQDLFPDAPIDSDKFLRLLDLFQTFTVQERRLGLMIGGKTTFNRWHFNIMTPWYYLERNHFVNQNVQDDIEALVEDIQKDLFGVQQLTPAQVALAEKQKNAFINQHLIADKFGIGDTRIYLDYPVIKRKYFTSRWGFLATIPTAFAMKKGLRGTSLHRATNRPLLDLQEIADQFIENHTLSPDVFNFGIAALDNLSAMLLDTPMGNGGHFGLGILARNKSPLSSLIRQDWARRFIMRNFISLEYLFPATEIRSFRFPVDEALFNARNLTDTTDPLIVNSNFAFIIQQLTDRLFPVALRATVHPGVVFRWSSQLTYEGDMAGFSLGTDTYVKNREKLSHVDANPITKKMIDIFNARAPLSYQSKAVGSIFFKIDKPDRLYTVALWGDYTFMNKGIGADFTLALNFDVVF
jgi:hypothetical protein